MPTMEFVLSELCDQVMTARAGRKPLFVCGGGTKAFYGNHRVQPSPDGHNLLDLTAYRGIVNYQPSELVVTARAGTPLAELEAALAEQGQMLAFEPPHFGPAATVGGCVAAGLAGPRRQAAGGVRDFVLGTRVLDAQGRMLNFGGEVMKNVAGYDVSRLLAGSLGIFGAILEVSLKVVPRPGQELTLTQEATEAQALERFNEWRSLPLPVSASSWHAEGGTETGLLRLRLSGTEPAVRVAQARLGGQAMEAQAARDWWTGLREQTHSFFAEGPLWRLAVAPRRGPLELGPTLIEWGGGQRWLRGHQDAPAVRAAARTAGGHATLFRSRGGEIPADGVFQAQEPVLAAIARRLKQEFDPLGIFNPGRMIPGL